MSDYYGKAKLEDWLYEEALDHVSSITEPDDIPEEVVRMFEFWRKDIEANIEAWMESDDGDGNQLSWRGWGRGFVPVENDKAFDILVMMANNYLKEPVE